MASISDLILQQVASAASNINVPANLQKQVVNGLSESILGSLTQTAAKAGGLEQIKGLLTGSSNAATSPITVLAGKLFSINIASALGLNATQTKSATGVIPMIMAGLAKIIKDRDGDGDVDLNDILLALKGDGNGGGNSILKTVGIGAAAAVLGGILKKKK